ncbi:MAG TPA: amidohydrolase family protein [Xanthobacteraceae bacterium]|nr:amidohydrolase family protein [Xanthobacteraceae bacterium]
MTSTLICNSDGIFTGLPGDAMRTRGAIRIRNGRIAAMGDLDPEPGEEIIDASGCVIYPGLISTHHHLFQSVLKGVRAGINLPLMGWLRSVPHSYWHKVDEEGLYTAARIGLVELLLSGTTTAADHHYVFSDTYRFDPADVIFEVARDLGLRLVFCRGGGTIARPVDGERPIPFEPLDAMIKSIAACAQRFHDAASDSMRRVVFAPTTPPWSVKPAELKVIAAAARALGLRLHSHLSETHDYVAFCLNEFGKRPVHWIAENDWLGPDVWFAHLVHLDEEEIELLVETGTGMSHCPQSNCRLGSGVAPADRIAARGGLVSLAVDGSASNEAGDMISEMHSAWHTHRAAKGAGATTVEEVVRWATVNGARVLGFPDIGVLAPGKLADLAIFNLSSPRYFGLHDPLSGPVAGAGAADLKMLMVGGRIVVENGVIPGLDLEKLRHDAAAIIKRIAN